MDTRGGNYRQSNSVVLIILTAAIFYSGAVNAVVPIPDKIDGFHYNVNQTNPDAIAIEAFFDPVCADCKKAWPPLKQALHHYGNRVSLTFHPFPLPYHDNAFAAARALHVVNSLNKSATFDMLEAFFKNQRRFYNRSTAKKSKVVIMNELVNFISRVIGKGYLPKLKSAFQDPKTNIQTRMSFKYACSRGVVETPFFFINGFRPVSNDRIDYKGWISILDPLINGHAKK